MKAIRWFLIPMVLLVAAPAARADRSGAVDVELWTDRGNDAVYQPGDGMEVKVRSSEDGYLLVYEIDSEGYVRLLWPDHGSRGFIEGRQTLEVPSPHSNLELVVESATGQGYLVAIASHEPFRDLPWYLRPYDLQAEGTGYDGAPDDEEGITREGRIVGDPFVAMERIRRTVLDDPDDPDAFGTAYTTYYVHERVRYPRYLCNDCHRPGYWAWWDGFDPYYATCSAFDFRVNWGWNWGPTYWFGTVPYYYYVVRDDCPPRYRMWSSHGSYSSWNGWRSWQNIMGGSIRRYKSPPPPGYLPPSKYKDGTRGDKVPPGLLVGRDVAPGRHGGGLRSIDPRTRDENARGLFRDPSGRIERSRDVGRGGLLGRRDDPSRGRGDDSRVRDRSRDEGRVERPRDVPRGGLVFRPRDPDRGRSNDNDREPSRGFRGNADHRDDRPAFREPPIGYGRSESRVERPRESAPEPRWERPRMESPRSEPRWERPRTEAPRSEPRFERPRAEAPRPEPRPVERRRDDAPRAPEGKPERHENRGGGRGGRDR